MFRFRGRAKTDQSPTPEANASTLPGQECDAESARDERLIRAAARGDLASFNVLVTRHERAVYNLCLRMLREVTAAEDATQDTFVRAWSSLENFRGGLVRPWLLRIATNRCYDLLRSRNRRRADSLDAAPFETEPTWTTQVGSEDPEGFSARAELSTHLERALARLPDDQRLVVILSDLQGHSYEEISEIAAVPVGTIKSRLSRARARLRDTLRDDPECRELFVRYSSLTEE
jgi:RNA polymerase sigma-70 factor (ECF subfamily)